MPVRILGGFGKGFEVITPKTNATRPTSVMLKRRLFDSYQDLSEFDFFDICAGSGSIGLEALSRNAQSVTFVESNSKVFSVLKQNVTKFKNKFNLSSASYKRLDLIRYLKTNPFELDLAKQKFVYFDPPYENIELYEKFFEHIGKIKNEFNGIIAIEACSQKTMKVEELENLFIPFDKIYKQGTNFLGIYILTKSE